MKSANAFPALLLAVIVLLVPSTVEGSAKIVIINLDNPGIGFNDPTPATPVGGNEGTTVGEQRLIAFQRAADLWASILDSDVEIRIRANFAPLECSANSGVLGSAGPLAIESDHPGAPVPDTWYHIALANRQAGEDRDPTGDDLRARFNGDLGKPGCLQNASWYYGLDANPPQGGIDLVVVLLHEFAHGLGFSELIDDANGSFCCASSPGAPIQPDAYSRFLFDNVSGLAFVDMSNSQRRNALTSGNLVWTGPAVTTVAPSSLDRQSVPSVTIDSPAAIAANYTAGRAGFGPRAFPAFSGSMALALDASNTDGPSTTDGCTALTNASAVAGKIALIDRGTCNFVTKVSNAQNAGAIAVIILDNADGTLPPGMGGKDSSITIPTLSLTKVDGDKIRAQLGAGVTGRGGEIETSPMIGADASGRVLVYAPNPIELGSSTSHWDRTATPNLLMEPSINQDLVHLLDLTTPHFEDIGWFAPAEMDVTMSSAPIGASGPAGPGDTIRYEVEITQVSGAAATSVRLKSALDSNVRLSSGSVLASKGEILTGNDAGHETVDVLLGGLKPNEKATVRFDAIVKDTVPAGTTHVISSTIVSGTNFNVLSRAAAVPILVNPMHATKSVTLVVDADDSGTITPGDTVRYQISLSNTGSTALTEIVVTDDLDEHLSTVQIFNPSAGTVIAGSTPGESRVVWAVPLLAGVTETLAFDALVSADVPSRVTFILNQATVTGTGFADTVTDNPDTIAPHDATSFGIEQPRRRTTRR